MRQGKRLSWTLGEMFEKGYGNVFFWSVKESGREKKLNERRVNRKGVRWKRRRWSIGYYRGMWRRQIWMKKREEFRRRVRAETWWKRGRVAKMLEVWDEEFIQVTRRDIDAVLNEIGSFHDYKFDHVAVGSVQGNLN